MARPEWDGTKIIYEGPPRWDGFEYVDGDSFCLSGPPGEQADLGVELAPEITGLGRESVEEIFDIASDVPGGRWIGEIGTRRTVSVALNFFGDNPAHLRSVIDRWERNHPSRVPGKPQMGFGKLWFKSKGIPDRYLFCRKSASAGTGTISVDIARISRLDKYDWGWTSDSPFFIGERKVHPLVNSGVVFKNISTADRTYPVIYVEGPSPGGNVSITNGLPGAAKMLKVPALTADEELRIDFSPANPSYLKRNKVTGVVSNVWSQLYGVRPRFEMAPGVRHTVASSVGPDAKVRAEYTPLFSSWI